MIARPMVLAAILGAAVLWVAGCSDSRRTEAEAVVRAYNEALILAYRTSDPKPLRGVTTEKEQRKLIALIDLKSAAGLVLESTLEELKVTSVETPNAGVMVVRTEERWRYFDRPLKPGVASGQEFVTRATLEYSFMADGKEWRMDQARTLQHAYLQPPGYGRDLPQEPAGTTGSATEPDRSSDQ